MKASISWYNLLQYTAMMAVMVMIPVDWKVGSVSLLALVALAAVSVVKMVCESRVGNPALGRMSRIGIWLMMAWVALYAVGILYSADKWEALSILQVNAVILIFPLVVLLTDTTYLTSHRVRWLWGALVAGVLLRIAGCAVWAGWRLAHGDTTWYLVFAAEGFDPRHHAYSALYAVPALALLLLYIADQGPRFNIRNTRLLLAWVAVAVVVFYLTLLNSRAGTLAMYAVSLAVVGYGLVVHRQWARGLSMAAVLMFLFWGMPQVRNGADKVAMMAEAMADGKTDTRIKVNQASLETYLQHPLFGHSPGDYFPAQLATYDRLGIDFDHSCHNQYFESLLALGIPGLLSLLLMLGWPLWVAVRERRHVLPVGLMVFVVAFNLLFESMLGRQMGLQFVGALYALMYLVLSQEENKFGQK